MQESSPRLEAIDPVLPVAAYQGGKRNLSARIVPRLDAFPHAAYVEAFVGMGGIFLRRRTRARGEVINDISMDVSTLFRVLQRHYVALMDMLRWQVTSRTEFERLVAANPDTLTDLERSARFLYLQRLAFGGKVTGRNFGVSVGIGARFDETKLGAILEDVHTRLAGVVIERLPFGELLRRYDRAGTLFYLDPPYWRCEGDYGPVFTQADFGRLADILATLKGDFLLSINDHPEVRRVFSAFAIEEVRTTYQISRQSHTSGNAGELLIAKPGSALLRVQAGS